MRCSSLHTSAQHDARSVIFFYVESVEVGNGVAISPDSKKGLIRVTEVKIKLGQFDKDEIPNLEELAHYLEKDLTERSVCNSNYKIKFV